MIIESFPTNKTNELPLVLHNTQANFLVKHVHQFADHLCGSVILVAQYVLAVAMHVRWCSFSLYSTHASMCGSLVVHVHRQPLLLYSTHAGACWGGSRVCMTTNLQSLFLLGLGLLGVAVASVALPLPQSQLLAQLGASECFQRASPPVVCPH